MSSDDSFSQNPLEYIEHDPSQKQRFDSPENPGNVKPVTKLYENEPRQWHKLGNTHKHKLTDNWLHSKRNEEETRLHVEFQNSEIPGHVQKNSFRVFPKPTN